MLACVSPNPPSCADICADLSCGTTCPICEGTGAGVPGYSCNGCESGVQCTPVPSSWTQVSGRYCDNTNTVGDSDNALIASYSTAVEAMTACESDSTCLYVSDGSCDNAGNWGTCSDDGRTSSSGSCMYRQPTIPSSWTQVSDRYCDYADTVGDSDSALIATYSTAVEAMAACESDSACLYVRHSV